MKAILQRAEIFGQMPYEYVCWKSLLIDIEPVELKLNYKVKQLSNKEFEEILNCDFMNYWFLNEGYSDEFDEFLKLLDDPKDFESLIDENLEKIFYSEEYNVWSDRILNVALLKHFANDKKIAQNLYSLYNDKKLKRDFFKNIIRKSIYEYFFTKNDKVKISAIEKMWVHKEA